MMTAKMIIKDHSGNFIKVNVEDFTAQLFMIGAKEVRVTSIKTNSLTSLKDVELVELDPVGNLVHVKISDKDFAEKIAKLSFTSISLDKYLNIPEEFLKGKVVRKLSKVEK